MKERHPSSPSATPRQGKAQRQKGKAKKHRPRVLALHLRNQIEHPTANVEWKGVLWLLTVNLQPMNLEPGLPWRSRSDFAFGYAGQEAKAGAKRWQ